MQGRGGGDERVGRRERQGGKKMGEAEKTREEMQMRKWGSETIGLAQGTPAPGDKKE